MAEAFNHWPMGDSAFYICLRIQAHLLLTIGILEKYLGILSPCLVDGGEDVVADAGAIIDLIG